MKDIPCGHFKDFLMLLKHFRTFVMRHSLSGRLFSVVMGSHRVLMNNTAHLGCNSIQNLLSILGPSTRGAGPWLGLLGATRIQIHKLIIFNFGENIE